MVLYEQPTEPWRALDYQLIEAFQILEDEICPQCSQPVWLCRSKDTELQFKVQRDVCRATARVDEDNWRTNNKGKNPDRDERASWGEIKYSRPYMIEYPGEPKKDLPTRAEYYESLIE